MTRVFLAAVAVVAVAAMVKPVSAQQLLGEYFTTIGHEDMRNSRGVPLGSFCAIVQQDRANFHRFGIRHQGDQADPFFGNREARAWLGANCFVVQGQEYVADRVLSGNIKYVWVRVFGQGGRLSYVTVGEGAG